MIFNFDSPFVAWYPVNNHQQLKEKYLPIITQQKQEIQFDSISFANNSHTSYYHRDLDNPLKQKDLIDAIVWQPFDSLLNEKQITPPPVKSDLQDIWWNYYYHNGYAKPHKHATSDFSGIYLLQLDEPNTTEFLQISGELPNHPFMQKEYPTQHITEGHVIIFPSFLLHYVTPCSKTRVVVSWNINTYFQHYD